MDKPLLTGRKKYHQGKYRPQNPSKYIGNVDNIMYRSSWEHILFKFLDSNPSVVKWASEELVLLYVSPIDGQQHRYFLDALAMVRQKDGSIKKFIIEVKPSKETRVPVPSKMKSMERLQEEIKTYSINQAKWKVAKEYAIKTGSEFLILTENELLQKPTRKKRRG